MPSPFTTSDSVLQQVKSPGSQGSPSPHEEAHTSPIGFVAPNYTPPPRNLILCFDGTAKYFNDGNTNVIRLFEGLDKMKSERQMCYYQPGIGTYISPTKAVGPISRRVSKAIDMAVAWYLDDHIMGGYRFLMENYREGDKICLFGFSRGAYTARCLAGMLHIVGLLPKGNEEQISFAFERYKNKSDDGVQKALGFKKAFSRHVTIEFMGVWDSVTSVGLNGKTLPFTSHNAVVKIYRQAFALDERRAKFRHNPWARAPFDGPPPEAMPSALSRFISLQQQTQEKPTLLEGLKLIGTAIRNILFLRRRTDPTHYRSDSDVNDEHARQCPDCNFPWGGKTDCREVWFAGSHSDVGGGEVDTLKQKNNLANPSLLWMVQQFDTKVAGVCWAPRAFDDIPTLKEYFKAKDDFASGKKRSTSRESESVLPQSAPPQWELPPSVLKELEKDVQGKVHDPLGGVSLWWLLEYVPLWKHFLDENKQQWKELK
ncbi:hypothetical protein FRC04_004792 [Tulasnella sp. 424]|nr:hypothetical protein FRC04_004792 [Tulasnella sp. 424]